MDYAAWLTDEEARELDEISAVNDHAEGLAAFIRRLSPHEPPPPHLDPLIALIERARHEVVRAVIAMPPRHAKTVTIMHGLAWWLSQSPADTHAYASYSDQQAMSKSGPTREIATRAGVQLRPDSTAKSEWRTAYGGGLLAGGVGAGLTGQGVSGLLVIDDPIKNPEEANSELQRENLWEWFQGVANIRLEGASIIVVMTRWHGDDLSGRLIDTGWEYLNLPAIAEVPDPDNGFPVDPLGRAPGEALWPERYPVAQCNVPTCSHAGHLDSIRKTSGEYVFSAMYQGRPRPRGSTLFGKPTYYDPETFTITGKQIIIYADPAATKKTTNDFAAIMAMAIEGSEPHEMRGWVLEVYHERVTVPTFMDDLRAFQERWGNTKAKIESFGMAVAIPQMLEKIDPGTVEGDSERQGDKFTRAQPAASAWNDGRIMVPISAPWLKEYLKEMGIFTGVNDAHDDQVDVTSGCWNSYEPPVRYTGGGSVVAKRRM